MTSAFICYSRKDKDVAQYIRARLKNYNVDGFIDYLSLRAGGFMKQLGHAIEQRDFFIPIISPDSVESDWVEAEVTWAFTNKKSIVPIRYKSARLTNVFVLESRESVDFGRWHTDRNMDHAIGRLMELMNISAEPTDLQKIPEPVLAKCDVRNNASKESDMNGENIPESPTFTRGEVQRVFEAAASVQNSDPEQALFLYQQVLDFDPEFMGGQITAFVARQKETLKPARLDKLKERIESAKRQGYWDEVNQLANTMLDIDPDNQYAKIQLNIVVANEKCEHIYRQAHIAKEKENSSAIRTFMNDIQQTCPEFGDPAGLLKGQPITKEFLGFLRASHTLSGHTGQINRVVFSSDSSMLATASTDASILIWSTESGQAIAKLREHAASVVDVAFSPGNLYLSSVSHDRKLFLWDSNRWQVIKSVDLHSVPSALVFSPFGSEVVVGGQSNRLARFGVPDLNDLDDIQLWSMPRVSIGSTSFHQPARSREAHVSSMSVSRSGLLAYSYRERETVSESRPGIYDMVRSTPRQRKSESQSTIEIWNTRGWDELNLQSPTAQSYIGPVRLADDGAYFAYLADDLHIRKLPRGREYHTLQQRTEIFDFAFSPIDASMLIYVDDGQFACRLVCYDLHSKKAIASVNAHEDTIRTIAMSPDGRFIATGSDDCTAKIWQL